MWKSSLTYKDDTTTASLSTASSLAPETYCEPLCSNGIIVNSNDSSSISSTNSCSSIKSCNYFEYDNDDEDIEPGGCHDVFSTLPHSRSFSDLSTLSDSSMSSLPSSVSFQVEYQSPRPSSSIIACSLGITRHMPVPSLSDVCADDINWNIHSHSINHISCAVLRQRFPHRLQNGSFHDYQCTDNKKDSEHRIVVNDLQSSLSAVPSASNGLRRRLKAGRTTLNQSPSGFCKNIPSCFTPILPSFFNTTRLRLLFWITLIIFWKEVIVVRNVLVRLVIYSPTLESVQNTLLPKYSPYLKNESVSAQTTTAFDAVVYIATGPVAHSEILGWSIDSVVQKGGWEGLICIISTDVDATKKSLINIESEISSERFLYVPLTVPSDTPPARAARLAKSKLLDILPSHIQKPLYLDSDIIVGHSLRSFADNVEQTWQNNWRKDLSANAVTIVMAEDANAFTSQSCENCDTWNTGVMSMRRGRSERCLHGWFNALVTADLSVTDQAALDEVVSSTDHCTGIRTFDTVEHVRMMKDMFVVMGGIRVKTFNHFTGLFGSNQLSPKHHKSYQMNLQKIIGRSLPSNSNSSSDANVVKLLAKSTSKRRKYLRETKQTRMQSQDCKLVTTADRLLHKSQHHIKSSSVLTIEM